MVSTLVMPPMLRCNLANGPSRQAQPRTATAGTMITTNGSIMNGTITNGMAMGPTVPR